MIYFTLDNMQHFVLTSYGPSQYNHHYNFDFLHFFWAVIIISRCNIANFITIITFDADKSTLYAILFIKLTASFIWFGIWLLLLQFFSLGFKIYINYRLLSNTIISFSRFLSYSSSFKNSLSFLASRLQL